MVRHKSTYNGQQLFVDAGLFHELLLDINAPRKSCLFDGQGLVTTRQQPIWKRISPPLRCFPVLFVFFRRFFGRFIDPTTRDTTPPRLR